MQNPKALIEYSNTNNNISDYSPLGNRKNVIVLDEVTDDLNTNKKFQAIIKYFFSRSKKLNISFEFITESYSSIPNKFRLSSTLYLIAKICNGKEMQNIAMNDSADTDYKYFINIYRKYTKFYWCYIICY